MNTSSRFVVAIHILAGLAIAQLLKKEKCITSELMAESVNTNPVVIRRILSTLRKAGLVASQTGPEGGSRLARAPEQITLLEVYQAVEDGKLFHLHYSTPNQECPIGANINGALAGVLDDAEAAMKDVLVRVTVGDIAREIIGRAGRFFERYR